MTSEQDAWFSYQCCISVSFLVLQHTVSGKLSGGGGPRELFTTLAVSYEFQNYFKIISQRS